MSNSRCCGLTSAGPNRVFQSSGVVYPGGNLSSRSESAWRPLMKRQTTGATITMALLAGSTCVMMGSALPAEVTPQRLVNTDKEPQNWLMNHRTYDGQRFSPLARINKGNVKNLKLAYAVPLGGSAGDEWLEATPLF